MSQDQTPLYLIRLHLLGHIPILRQYRHQPRRVKPKQIKKTILLASLSVRDGIKQ